MKSWQLDLLFAKAEKNVWRKEGTEEDSGRGRAVLQAAQNMAW